MTMVSDPYVQSQEEMWNLTLTGERRRQHRDARAAKDEQLAKFLGWFGVGLGLAEVIAPRALARLIGIRERDNRSLLQFLGAREISNGIGVLMQPRRADPTAWITSKKSRSRTRRPAPTAWW